MCDMNCAKYSSTLYATGVSMLEMPVVFFFARTHEFFSIVFATKRI